jgi:DNA adenine methylase
LDRFPPELGRYVEVFGGAGWVLFRKPSGPETEIFNDKSTNLVNLYRCVRATPEELISRLEYVLNSRIEFERVREAMKNPCSLTDVERAALFYQQIRYSYASGLKSYANTPHSMWGNFPLIRECCARLQRVVIENKDFESLIGLYDRPDTFFYNDPPYYETEDYYRDVKFGKTDHERLAETLLHIEGKFLLSYNDCPEIMDLYEKPGITIERISRLSNMAQRYEGGKMYAELLISNYNTTQSPYRCYQMSLYDILPESCGVNDAIGIYAEESEVIQYG